MRLVELVLLENSSRREELLKSFFNLAKFNGGLFKSDKQAQYLLSQAEDGVFTINQTISFGTSSYSQRQVGWRVYLDNQGITKIEKETGSKGIELYWERTPEFAAKQQAAADRRSSAAYDDISGIIRSMEEQLQQMQDKYDRLKGELDHIFNGPMADQFASTKDIMYGSLKQDGDKIEDLKARIEKQKEDQARFAPKQP